MEFEAVLEAAKAGEPRAFEDLFHRLARPVAGFLRARGAPDPDGLANEVLLRAFRAVAGFDGNEIQFRAWVFTIARNVLVDERRRQRRRIDARVSLSDEYPDVAVPDDASVLVAQERVRELLDRLSPDQRDVLLLRVIGDLGIRETAEVLGKSEGAVKLLQHRALSALRKFLSDRSDP